MSVKKMVIGTAPPVVVALIASTLAVVAIAADDAQQPQQVITRTESFGVQLSTSRVIYRNDVESMAVLNEQNYPMLVHSSVVAEDKISPAPFVVTPPLFRLEGKQQSRLRIVRSGEAVARDRETLQWLCVMGIPPKANDVWAQDQEGKSAAPSKSVALNVQVSINQCIKLLERPASVQGQAGDVASSLVWSQQLGKLTVNNPTPFFMDVRSVKVGSTAVDTPDYVSPFSSHSYPLPKGAAGRQIEWQVVDDHGGLSQAYRAELK